MRKTLSLILVLSLLFSLSSTLSAQKTEQELDQLELFKQFIGTWKAEAAADTFLVVSFVPRGGGMEFTLEVKTKDTTFYTSPGVYGFSSDKKTVRFAGVDGDGNMSLDYGRFVTDKKFIAEVYQDNAKHPRAIEEVEFISPESFTTQYKSRGNKMTWDAEWSTPLTFNKIK